MKVPTTPAIVYVVTLKTSPSGEPSVSFVRTFPDTAVSSVVVVVSLTPTGGTLDTVQVNV